MEAAERLERFDSVLDDLSELSADHVLLVEGRNDVLALEALGIHGDFFCVQVSGGPVRAAEYAWNAGKPAVILTDWDRRGDSLEEDLARNLSSLGVRFDTAIRERLSWVCRPYCKDVENVHNVHAMLERDSKTNILRTAITVSMSGSFIVLEGIDGAGKSSLCARLSEELRSRGIDTVVTAEPTHEGIGAFIRSGGAGSISQATEALLFSADRNDHTERIGRWVDEGKMVICDRYFASTVAYQSAVLDGGSADTEWLISINSQFIDRADLTVLLDLDPGTSMGRVGSRGEEESKFERADFLAQVRSGYLALAERFGFAVVDAAADADSVYREVLALIEKVIRCIRPRRYSARRARGSEEKRSSWALPAASLPPNASLPSGSSSAMGRPSAPSSPIPR
jgi:dTMP kinase